MPAPIVVTALVGELGAVVAKEVAKKLDQDFLNLETALQNHLSQVVQQKYSQNHLQTIEQKQICLALQKKSVVFAPYDTILHNKNLFVGQKVFYVFAPKSALPKFDVVGQIAFDDRDKILSQYAEKIDFFKFDTEKITSEIIKKVRTKQ